MESLIPLRAAHGCCATMHDPKFHLGVDGCAREACPHWRTQHHIHSCLIRSIIADRPVFATAFATAHASGALGALRKAANKLVKVSHARPMRLVAPARARAARALHALLLRAGGVALQVELANRRIE